MKKTSYLYIFFFTLSILLFPTMTMANTEFGATATSASYVLLAPLPCIGTAAGTTCTTTNGSSEITSIVLQGYLIYVFKLLIALTVFLAVLMTIIGGFQYLAVESVTGKSAAKETIENAIKGLVLALASYLILYTINPNLVDISKVAVPKLNVSVTQAPAAAVVCYANGKAQTKANIVPCAGTTVNSPTYNTNPDGSRVLPAPGTNTCTTQGHYNSREHTSTPGSSYTCDSNGNVI